MIDAQIMQYLKYAGVGIVVVWFIASMIRAQIAQNQKAYSAPAEGEDNEPIEGTLEDLERAETEMAKQNADLFESWKEDYVLFRRLPHGTFDDASLAALGQAFENAKIDCRFQVFTPPKQQMLRTLDIFVIPEHVEKAEEIFAAQAIGQG